MKQINLYNPFWKEVIKYLGWFLLFAVLWFRGCSGSEKSSTTAKVEVPKVKGKFEPKKPVHESVSSKMEHTATGKEILQVENPIDEKLIVENEKLKADFTKETDSLKKEILFSKVASLNRFSTNFEDENLILNIEGIVQGEVKEITPNYIRKKIETEIPIKNKQTVFRLLGGMELGNTHQLNAFRLKANLMFQDRQGNILSGSYDTDQRIWIGYNFSIFDVKR